MPLKPHGWRKIVAFVAAIGAVTLRPDLLDGDTGRAFLALVAIFFGANFLEGRKANGE